MPAVAFLAFTVTPSVRRRSGWRPDVCEPPSESRSHASGVGSVSTSQAPTAPGYATARPTR